MSDFASMLFGPTVPPTANASAKLRRAAERADALSRRTPAARDSSSASSIGLVVVGVALLFMLAKRGRR